MFAKLEAVIALKPLATAVIVYASNCGYTDQNIFDWLLEMLHTYLVAVSCDPEGQVEWHISVSLVAQVVQNELKRKGCPELLMYCVRGVGVPILIRFTPNMIRESLLNVVATLQPIVMRHIPRVWYGLEWQQCQVWPPFDGEELNRLLPTFGTTPRRNMWKIKATPLGDPIETDRDPELVPTLNIEVLAMGGQGATSFDVRITVPRPNNRQLTLHLRILYNEVASKGRMAIAAAKAAATTYNAAKATYAVGTLLTSSASVIPTTSRAAGSAIYAVFDNADEAAVIVKGARAAKDSCKFVGAGLAVAGSAIALATTASCIEQNGRAMVENYYRIQTITPAAPEARAYYTVLRYLMERNYIRYVDGVVSFPLQNEGLLLGLYNSA